MPWILHKCIPIAGYVVLLGIVVLVSYDRKKIPWKLVLWGVGLQLLIAVFMLATPIGAPLFLAINRAVTKLLDFTLEGTSFLLKEFSSGEIAKPLHCFLFIVLPTIIFFSSLMAVLYHLGVMQRIIAGIAWVLRKTMRVSAAEAMTAAANVFVGHTEAPLVIRPYVPKLTKSELASIMVAGFGTMAGGVIVAYSSMLSPFTPDVAGHLVTASLMNAAAALVVGKILVPEKETPQTLHLSIKHVTQKQDANFIGAAARGAAEGMTLFLNVAAMLLAFIALVALANYLLSALFSIIGVARIGPDGKPDALQWIVGQIMAPVAMLTGIEPHNAAIVGRLLGEKLVLNEFVAYMDLAESLRTGTFRLTEQETIISIYALCGFANLSSIAIQIGGIGGIAPNLKETLARFGLRAMLGGFIVSCLSACMAALFL